ncbi:MAG: sugar transferase [Chloroflexi bacterium]|nr:sugar transferase [Chloroflexota bacterium]
MLRQFSVRRIIGFFLIDSFGSLAMLALAGWLRFQAGGVPTPIAELLTTLRIQVGGTIEPELKFGSVPLEVFALVAIVWPLFFISFAIYDGRRNETIHQELLNVFLAVCVAMVVLAGILFLTYRETSRVVFLLFFGFDVALLLGARVVLHAYRLRLPNHDSVAQRVALVVGAGKVGQNAAAQLKKYAARRVRVVGYLDDDPACEAKSFDGVPVLGTLHQVSAVKSAYAIQDAIVALPLDAHERLVTICRQLHKLGVRVYVIPDLFALSFPGATLDGFGGIPVIDLGQPGIHGWRRFIKRVSDSLAVAVGLILIAPLLALVALWIKLDSPGPIFYRQERIGENGRVFAMFKFRSMRVNADAELHKTHITRLITENLTPAQVGSNGNGTLKLEADPRITRVGKWIRKTSIDELPQLFNVLRGEMSLVGPRPPIAYEVELYQDWHRRRFEAIPGITGLWQVRGRNLVSFDEMVRMDLEYIQHQSVWLDLKILLQTPLAVLRGRGAG